MGLNGSEGAVCARGGHGSRGDDPGREGGHCGQRQGAQQTSGAKRLRVHEWRHRGAASVPPSPPLPVDCHRARALRAGKPNTSSNCDSSSMTTALLSKDRSRRFLFYLLLRRRDPTIDAYNCTHGHTSNIQNDAKVANRTGRDFAVGDRSRGRVRDARRFPSSRL
jgi:hypothetical protein